MTKRLLEPDLRPGGESHMDVMRSRRDTLGTLYGANSPCRIRVASGSVGSVGSVGFVCARFD